MIRKAIRRTLSALAATAIVTTVAVSPASAEQEMEYLKQEKWLSIQTTKGLTTKKQAWKTGAEATHGNKTLKKPGKYPVGFRDESFRTNDRIMTMR